MLPVNPSVRASAAQFEWNDVGLTLICTDTAELAFYYWQTFESIRFSDVKPSLPNDNNVYCTTLQFNSRKLILHQLKFVILRLFASLLSLSIRTNRYVPSKFYIYVVYFQIEDVADGAVKPPPNKIPIFFFGTHETWVNIELSEVFLVSYSSWLIADAV